MKQKINVNREAMNALFPEIPQDFEARMRGMIESMPLKGKERDERICEITVPINGVTLRAESSSKDNLFMSIDSALAKLERQILRHRTKLEKRLKETAYQDETPEFIEDISAYGTGERKIVRTKTFPVRPMAVEDAILQMELLGHSFFVFVNIETERTNVLYLRKDGNLGLLEPEA